MNFDYIFKKHKITEKYIEQTRIYVELGHNALMSVWRQQGLIVEGEVVKAKQNWIWKA